MLTAVTEFASHHSGPQNSAEEETSSGAREEAFASRFSDAHALGFSPFPLIWGSKKPAVKWKHYQTNHATLVQAREWDDSDFNVGIATGQVSGIFVVDTDSDEADAEAWLRGYARDDTACVKTAKGRHYYYRIPNDFRVTNTTRFAGVIGIDIRGEGGLVVAAGSVRANGYVYRWEKHPNSVPIADAPAALLKELRRAGNSSKRQENRRHQGRMDDDPEMAGLVARLANAETGERNDLLNKAGFRLGQLVAAGLLKREEWEKRLRTAALACGLLEQEIERTLSHAIDDGKANPVSSDVGVRLTDFHAFMPSHNYIFAPNGESWPATSVNSRIAPVLLFDPAGQPILDERGNQKRIAANQWLDHNRPVEQITWAPGQPQVIPNCLISGGGWIARLGCNVFNFYQPATQLPGDARLAGPWLEHVHRLYPAEAEHILNWLSQRVQRPQDKINHALVLGGAQGIGKDTILVPVKFAFGPWNFAEVSPQQMLGRFNGFIKSVILRVNEARDLGDVDRFAFYDHTKAYTASPPDVLRVDEKFQREYSVFNVCGLIITTNHKGDGLFLPEDDRRHYVAWSDRTKDNFTPEYWQRLWAWFGNGGVAHVTAFLAERDLSAFDAKAPPPKTDAFWDIVASNSAPEAAELTDALEVLSRPRVVTLAAITEVAEESFRGWLQDRRNSRRVPHKMEECGYRSVRNPTAKSGRWKVNKKGVVIYARRELSPRDAIRAAQALAERGEDVPI